VHLTETLHLHGLNPSTGTVGDAYDNTLAETTIGLYKTECIRDDSPFRRGPLTSLSSVEAITANWIHCYNTSRLMHRPDPRPPAEADYYHRSETTDQSFTHHRGCNKPGTVQSPNVARWSIRSQVISAGGFGPRSTKAPRSFLRRREGQARCDRRKVLPPWRPAGLRWSSRFQLARRRR
jgi:hypothetical protein